MTRGRKCKPTAAKIRAGNPGRRSLNPAEPKPAIKLPTCPRHLDPVARKEWRRVARTLVDLGILTPIDRAVLVAYCRAWSLYVEADRKVQEQGSMLTSTKTGLPYQNPYLNQLTAASKDMVRYATELGMTPASRSRIDAKPPTKGDTGKGRFLRIVG